MEAVKQGSCVVGLRSKQFAVIAAMRARQSDFASYQQKIFPIDDHVGCAISGLTADGRVLHSYMRTECLNHRFVYEAPLNVGRLVNMISQSMSSSIMRLYIFPFRITKSHSAVLSASVRGRTTRCWSRLDWAAPLRDVPERKRVRVFLVRSRRQVSVGEDLYREAF